MGRPTSDADLAARIESLRHTDDHQSFGYHSLVSVSRRYLCLTVPKVACTTIKMLLHRLDAVRTPPPEIHNLGARLADFGTAELVEMLTAAQWLRFGFVRNPYGRLFSAYKSKIGNGWEQEYRWLQDDIRDANAYPMRAGRRAGTVAFADFVRYVAQSDDPRVVRDGHLNLQSNILLCDCISYDVLGRFETLADDLRSVLQRLGAPAEIAGACTTVTNATTHVPLAAAYDKALADIAYATYEPDFRSFGYDRDSWMFVP